MNIVFVAPFGLGQKTTVWARTLPLAQELVRAGHRGTIVIPPWDTPDDAGVTATREGVDLINVSLTGGLLPTLRRMVRIIQEREPEIVHVVKPRAHAGLIQWWLWQRRRLTGRGPRLLLDIDDWEQAWASINHYTPPVARFLAWQEEWGIRHADGITTASRWLTDRAREYAPATPQCYVPNGVSVVPNRVPHQATHSDHATLDSGAVAYTILYYTRFVEISPQWLTDFWRAMRASEPDARLHVAGSALIAGRERAFQHHLAAADADASAAVTWHGFVDGPTQEALYAAADCAIFPARTEPLQEAKCSVRLATTLLHGVPVVASAVGEQASYGGGGAAQLLPADATPAEFAADVLALLRNPAQAQAMTARARDHLHNQYAWDILGHKLVEFYADILHR